MEIQFKTKLTIEALKKAYVQAVGSRNGTKAVIFNFNFMNLAWVAKKLPDPKLAKLFVEAQFSCMPSYWCKEKFNRPYPPLNIVFGGRCIERYRAYIGQGTRTPV